MNKLDDCSSYAIWNRIFTELYKFFQKHVNFKYSNFFAITFLTARRDRPCMTMPFCFDTSLWRVGEFALSGSSRTPNSAAAVLGRFVWVFSDLCFTFVFLQDRVPNKLSTSELSKGFASTRILCSPWISCGWEALFNSGVLCCSVWVFPNIFPIVVSSKDRVPNNLLISDLLKAFDSNRTICGYHVVDKRSSNQDFSSGKMVNWSI